MSAKADPKNAGQAVSSRAIEIRSLIDRARSLSRTERATAEQQLRRAIVLAVAAGLHRLEASARHELGCNLRRSSAAASGDEAVRELKRALELRIELGDLRGQCKGLIELGTDSFQRSDLASAVPFLHEAERLCKLTGNLLDLAIVYELSAGVYGTAGDGKAALEYANLHFQAATRLGDARQLVHALDGLGCTESELGLHAEAQRHLEAALAEAPRIADAEVRTFTEVMVLVDLADALGNAERWEDAKRHADRAAAIAEIHRYNGPRAQALYCAARALVAGGDDAAAEKALRQSHTLFDEIGHKNYKSKVERELSKIYRLRGDYKRALEFFERAISTETAMRGNAAMNQIAQQRAREKLDDLRREKDAERGRQIEEMARLKRFLSPQIADLIVSGASDDPLKSHRREITVVFLDLRGFTAFTEIAGPEEVMGVLHEYHAEMGRLIMAHNGTIEHFAGDGIMIFFNDPVVIENPAKQAVNMAIRMQADFARLAQTWKQRGYDLHMGIGIAQGYATLGTIGFEGRRDYGAIGPVTNLASRLCSDAKAGQILVSQEVFGSVEELVTAEPVGELCLKGFQKPVFAFNVTGLK